MSRTCSSSSTSATTAACAGAAGGSDDSGAGRTTGSPTWRGRNSRTAVPSACTLAIVTMPPACWAKP
ncbi:Uncharacterised protein [Bordetella pertussis]|nr:Uncharacterised protein [Bordetella pertussis]